MKSFLYVIFAIVLVSWSHVSYAQNNTAPPKDTPATITSEKAETPTDRSAEKPKGENKKRASETVSPINVTSEKVSTDNRAIDIAEKANHWSKLQTIINAGGLILLALTTLFALGAWLAAKRGAKIAQDTLKETKRSTELEMQPYLSCEGVTVEPSHLDGDNDVLVQMSMMVKNNGKTPAYIEQNEDSSIGTYIGSSDLKKAKPHPLLMDARTYIAPNETETIYLASTYYFDNFKKGDPLEGLSINGDIVVHHWDHFTPTGKRKATSFRFMWNKDTRKTSDDKSAAKLTRTQTLKMQDIDDS